MATTCPLCNRSTLEADLHPYDGTVKDEEGRDWHVTCWEQPVEVAHELLERAGLLEALGAELEEPAVCGRCHRELKPWPLERGPRCAPRDWAYCISQA